MIYSSRDILAWREQLLAIAPEQWLLLAIGLVAGGCVWILFNRRIVHRIVNHLRSRSLTDNLICLVESALGSVVFVANACLVYLATLVTSFFLFSFALAGVLVGAWITIPASFE